MRMISHNRMFQMRDVIQTNPQHFDISRASGRMKNGNALRHKHFILRCLVDVRRTSTYRGTVFSVCWMLNCWCWQSSKNDFPQNVHVSMKLIKSTDNIERKSKKNVCIIYINSPAVVS